MAIAAPIEHVTQNLVALHAAMRARLRLARGGTPSQSQQSLIELGRRVSAMNFVMFGLAVDDALQGHIVPLALVAQIGDVGLSQCGAELQQPRPDSRRRMPNLAE